MGPRRSILATLALVAGCSYPEFAFAPASDSTAEDAAVDVRLDVIDASDTSDTADTRDSAVPSRTWLFDFGQSTRTTTGYNNLTESHAVGGALTGLVDATGAASSLAIRVDATDCFHDNANGVGTTSAPTSLGLAASATSDSLYGSTMTWNGVVRARALVELTGLDPALAYDLELFASRLMGTGVLETAYSVRGAAPVTTRYLDANDNVSSTVTFAKVRPTTTGSIAITVAAGPKNTSPYGFYYLGAMRLTSTSP